MQSKDHWPVRAIVEICEAVSEEMEQELSQHVEKYHLPAPQCGPLRAAPHAKDRIADVELAQMLEAVENEGLILEELAERFGRPVSLILRELKAYQKRHLRWTDQYAWEATLAG